jgi:hypothetical protein
MKKKFMNFLDKLSRSEMRTIIGGYSGGGGSCTCLQGDPDGTCTQNGDVSNTGNCACTSDRAPTSYTLNSDDC